MRFTKKEGVTEGLVHPESVFLMLLAASAGLILIQVLVSQLVPSSSELLGRLPSGLTGRDAMEALSSVAEVIAAVLGIAITVVAIVVELAANRYSHQITRLFLTAPNNLLVLSLYALTTIQCIWVGVILAPEPGFGTFFTLVITMILASVSLISLVPYIYSIFSFLSPDAVVRRIGAITLRQVVKAQSDASSYRQDAVETGIDELQDVARSAITHGDREIAMLAVNSLSDFLIEYHAIKQTLPEDWFRVSEEIRQDPDFIALSDTSLSMINEQGLWVERKVFRRLLSLMAQSAHGERDVAHLISIRTREIAGSLGQDTPGLMDLCLFSYNSYLRTMLNAGDIRTTYYLFGQYRLLAESLLGTPLEARVLEIARYFKEYGHVGHQRGFSFLLETASFDLMTLIGQTASTAPELAEPLIGIASTFELGPPSGTEKTNTSGLVRIKIQLACLLMARGFDNLAIPLIDRLADEDDSLLTAIRDDLIAESRPHYWELIDRGINFLYLPSEQRVMLEPLFAKISAHRGQNR